MIYRVLGKNHPTAGIARAGEGVPENLPIRGVIEGWPDVPWTFGAGEFLDLQPNDRAFRLCSERLKQIIADGASKDDRLQWLPVSVVSEREQRDYYVLHLPEPLDAINKTESIMVGDFVVKPVFKPDLVSGHNVFTYQGTRGHTWFVGEAIARAIRAARCTGLELSKAPVR